jgi:hypothetical protein
VPRKKQRERRRPHGFGSVVKKVSRGYVVFKPKVVDLRPAHLDGPNGLYARLRATGLGSSSLMYAHDYVHAALRWGARRRGVPVHPSILDGAVDAPSHANTPKRPATGSSVTAGRAGRRPSGALPAPRPRADDQGGPEDRAGARAAHRGA